MRSTRCSKYALADEKPGASEAAWEVGKPPSTTPSVALGEYAGIWPSPPLSLRGDPGDCVVAGVSGSEGV
jgi:hypothetical protein